MSLVARVGQRRVQRTSEPKNRDQRCLSYTRRSALACLHIVWLEGPVECERRFTGSRPGRTLPGHRDYSLFVEGAQEKASGAVDLVNRHWATTAVIGAGSAAAIFLMFTERGQTLTRKMKGLTADSYDALSEYVINGWDQLKEVVQGTPLTEGASEKSEMDEKIHQLQEKFKSPAA